MEVISWAAGFVVYALALSIEVFVSCKMRPWMNELDPLVVTAAAVNAVLTATKATTGGLAACVLWTFATWFWWWARIDRPRRNHERQRQLAMEGL